MTAVASRIETGERTALRDQLRRAISRSWDDRGVLEFADGNGEAVAGLSAVLQGALGLDSLLAPEELGGAGGTWVDAALIAEELGAAQVPSNLLRNAMTMFLLRSAGTDVTEQLLAETIQAQARCVVLWPGDDARWDPDGVAAAVADGSRVTGQWSNVPGVSGCSSLLLPCSDDGLGLGIARIDDSGAARFVPMESADVLRPLHRVVLSGQPCDVVRIAAPASAFRGTIAIGAVILAAEMVGGAAACLKRTVDYTTSRTQFGRPLASFQALKHRIADVVVAIEAARSLAYRAAERATARTHDRPDDPEYIALARAAKASAGDALRLAATECIQTHGAMGFTWEIPAHLYLKRWACSESLYGRAFELRRLMFRAELAERRSA